MRHFALSLLLCGWCGIAFSCDKAESGPKEEPAESQWRNQSFTLATWNVAFDNPVPWDDRKAMAASVFDTQDFDIIGIQEPWRHALDDLIAMLPDYDHTGTSVTGNPADTDCHNNPIFYKKERFELLDSGSILVLGNSRRPRFQELGLLRHPYVQLGEVPRQADRR